MSASCSRVFARQIPAHFGPRAALPSPRRDQSWLPFPEHSVVGRHYCGEKRSPSGTCVLSESNPTLGTSHRLAFCWPETEPLGRKMSAMKLRTLQAPAWALFSALLLLLSCDKGGLGFSAHKDGSTQASADAGTGGSRQGGLGGFGGVTDSGGIVSTGSGGMPTGSGGNYPSVSSGGGYPGSGGTLYAGEGDTAGTSGGASGVGGSGTISTDPVGPDGLLYSGATEDFTVSKDERHVAFMRDYLPTPPCSEGGVALTSRSRQVGTLLVASLADDGTVAVRVVGQSVKYYSVGFSADSKSMVFVDGYDPCSRGGVLKIAAADGRNPRAIATVPKSFLEQILGNTLLFPFPDTGGVGDPEYALWLPDGAPILMPSDSVFFTQELSTARDGKYLAYFDAARAITVLNVTTGASHKVDPGPNEAGYDKLVLSGSGSFLALETAYVNYQYKGAIAVVAVDGTKATPLASDYSIQVGEFSPDGSRLAYYALDGSTGAPEIVVHSLSGGTDVHLQGLPDPASNWIGIGFSPDGAVLFVRAPDADRSSAGASLYMAPASAKGSLQLITSGTNGFPFFSPGNSNLAVTLDSGSTEVHSFAAANSNILPGTFPVYEPNSNQPRLLLLPVLGSYGSSPEPAFLLASTDGSNLNTVYLPAGAVSWGSSPQWIGHSVVYGFHPATPGGFGGIYVYGGSSSSGVSSSPTLVANGPDKYASAPISAPTRLFYARAAASTAGPAGLWMVTVP